MKKQSIIAIVTILVIISATISWLVMSDYSFFGADNSQEKQMKAYAELIGAESIGGGSREHAPEVKYQLFIAGRKTTYILGSQYIYAQDVLPQTITVRGHNITIKNIRESLRNPKSKVLPQPGSFSMVAETDTEEVLTIQKNGAVKSIHVPLTKCDDSADVDVKLCDQFPPVSNDCDSYKNYLSWYIEEIDIDPATKEWNFIKVSFGLYQEGFCGTVTTY